MQTNIHTKINNKFTSILYVYDESKLKRRGSVQLKTFCKIFYLVSKYTFTINNYKKKTN